MPLTPLKQEPVRARVMLRLSSGNVVGDNLWLWRADHDVAGLVPRARATSIATDPGVTWHRSM